MAPKKKFSPSSMIDSVGRTNKNGVQKLIIFKAGIQIGACPLCPSSGEQIYPYGFHQGGQGQLTVKGSSKRMIPRFQEPISGYKVKVSRIEEAYDSMNLLPSTALDPIRVIFSWSLCPCYFTPCPLCSVHASVLC